MANHRVIRVQFKGVTNTLGNRIVLTESRFNKTDRKTISYDYEVDNTLAGAIKYLEEIGIKVTGYGDFKDAYYIFSNSWANGKGFTNISGEVED